MIRGFVDVFSGSPKKRLWYPDPATLCQKVYRFIQALIPPILNNLQAAGIENN